MHYLVALFTILNLCFLVASDPFGRLQAQRESRAEHLRKHVKHSSTESPSEHVLNKRASPFLNAKSKKFSVNGSALPDVDFDVGESYAGLLPISDHPDETRQLYFWFFPSKNKAAKKEITIWLQGGPGGASTAGLLLENGPILLQPGTVRPTRNTYSWTNITNMVWIDQPVGTGFSVGNPNITNQYELTEQFMGFFKNFIETFNMQGYKVYLTGESYAGYYIPYIANGFIDANDTKYFNLKGAAINDPIIGNEVIQFQGVAMQYLNTWSEAFGLNSSAMARFNAQNEKCGYDEYLRKYFTFPPPQGPFPGPFGNENYGTNMPKDCDIQDDIIEAEYAVNPCFNIEHLFDTCPVLYNALGAGLLGVDYNPPGPPVYYNRPAVREALHAPPNKTWMLAGTQVFVGKKTEWEVSPHDMSLPPAQIDIVSKIIEATNNIIIGVGGLDFQLPANGTLFVLQNVTWNGAQGFSSYPNRTLYVPPHAVSNLGSLSGHGDMGIWTSERGLTFYKSNLAGHEIPWYTPGVSYRVIQTLLGRIPNLSATGNF